jgi:hypothetical protein
MRLHDATDHVCPSCRSGTHDAGGVDAPAGPAGELGQDQMPTDAWTWGM